MGARNFLQGALLTKVADHSAAATDPIESAIVDLAGFTGVVFFTSFGTAAANNYLTVQQDDLNAAGGMADLLGSKVASGTSDEDVICEVAQPTKRYVRAYVVRGTSSTCESIWCLRYGAATPQLTANSVTGTQIAELHVTPIEGTA
jgi:hypothetical protein